MAYQANFAAYRGADWAEAVEITDADTNLPLDVSGYSFELGIQDQSDATLISLSTSAGTITFSAANIIAWRVTASQINSLCKRKTYRVGCRFTTNEGTEQLFTGNLAILDGEITQ